MDFTFKSVIFNRKKILQAVLIATDATFSDCDVEDYDVSFLITKNSEIKKINNDYTYWNLRQI